MSSLVVTAYCSISELRQFNKDILGLIQSHDSCSCLEGTLFLGNLEINVSLNGSPEKSSTTSEFMSLEAAMEEAYAKCCFDTAKVEIEQCFKTLSVPWTSNCDTYFNDFYSFKNSILSASTHSRSSSLIFEAEDSSAAEDFLTTEFTRLAKLKHKLEKNYLASEKLIREITADRAKLATEKKLLQDLKAELIEAMAFRDG